MVGEEVVRRGVKQRVTGSGNKMGTLLRNDGEGLGKGRASCYRHGMPSWICSSLIGEKWLWDVVIEGGCGCGCRAQETARVETLGGVRKESSREQILDFRRAFSFCSKMRVGMLQKAAVKGKGSRGSWPTFMDSLHQAQEQSIAMLTKTSRHSKRCARVEGHSPPELLLHLCCRRNIKRR